jgi:hypothetical protein
MGEVKAADLRHLLGAAVLIWTLANLASEL